MPASILLAAQMAAQLEHRALLFRTLPAQPAHYISEGDEMKIYLAMCSFCLAAGAALGHINGKYVAAAGFLDNCDNLRFVVFHDPQADEQRHFHCFELDLPETGAEEQGSSAAPVPVI